MKRNMTLRKLMALVLSLVLTLSLTTAAFATGNVGGNTPTCDEALGCRDGSHTKDCPLRTENPDIDNPDDPSKNVTPPPAACTENGECALKQNHTENCPRHPDNAAAIQAVQDMINLLPAEVTADNLGDVEAELGKIQTALTALKNDACRSAVNAGKKLTAETSLASFKAAQELEARKTALSDLIAALPAPDAVTVENKGAVQASLTAIEGYTDIWTEDQESAYDAVKVAVGKLNTSASPAEPTPKEAAAALLASLPAEVNKDNVADVETVLGSIAAYEDILTNDQRATRDAYQASVNAVRAQMNLDRVNELMGKLPEAGTVTAESLTEEQANAYKAQLAEIDNALLTLTDEQKATVDKTRYESLANALGSYYEAMNMADDVAEITASDGTVKKFDSLQKAIEEVNSDETITLLSEVKDYADNITISGKVVTIDLNNKNISFALNKHFVVHNGTLNITGTGMISESQPNYSPILIYGVDDGTKKSEVNIGKNVTLQGWAGLFINQNSGNNQGIVANVSGTLIGVPDTANRVGTGLYVNGAIDNTGNVPKISLTDANVKTVNGGTGMYLAGYAETTITGSTITSDNTGIEIRAGKLTISGTTVTGGTGEYNYLGNGNGSTSNNAALAIAQHGTKLPLEVTIESGTFTGGAAVAQANPEGNNDAAIALVKLDIQNGNFSGKIYSENKKNFVTGGTFSSPVDETYCADNFHCNATPDGDDKYTVHEHKTELRGKVDATCGKDGYSGDMVCTVCNGIVKKGSIESRTGNHTYGEWVYNVKDCATGGTRVKTCTVCGDEVTENVSSGAAHQYDESTWIRDASAHWHGCKVCDSTKDKAPHSFVWVTVSRAASGTEVQRCTTCGYESQTDWSKLELALGSNRTTVRSGNTITYTLTVTNKTGMDMDVVEVSGDLDKNLTFTKSSGNGEYDSKNGIWTVFNLDAGESATMTLKVTVKKGVKSGTKLEYTAAVTYAQAYNGETFPDAPLGSVTSTVKVSSSSVFSTNPKTGDPNNVGLWITIMAVSLTAIVAVIVVLIIKSRKKK